MRDGEAAGHVWRCEVTGNPAGTDTQCVGHECQCQGCRAYMLLRTPTPAGLGAVERLLAMHDEIVSLTGWSTMADLEPKQYAFRTALQAALASVPAPPGFVTVPVDVLDEAIGAMDGAVAGLAAFGTPLPTLRKSSDKLRAARDARLIAAAPTNG